MMEKKQSGFSTTKAIASFVKSSIYIGTMCFVRVLYNMLLQ